MRFCAYLGRMTMFLRWLCLLLAMATLPAGCGDAAVDPAVKPGETLSGKPALWRADGPNGPIWLFGSIHALPDNIDWDSPALDRAIASSDRLFLEVVGLDDPAAIGKVFNRLGNSPGQRPLDERIAPELRDKAHMLQEAGKIDDARFATLESWAAAIALSNVSSSMAGVSSANGVESAVTAKFVDQDKPIFGLETAAAQFAYFDGLPEADQRLMLSSVIADSDKATDMYRDMLDNWLAGDVSAISKVTRAGMLAQPEIRAAILLARNKDWATKLDAMARNGHRPLVVVGAAHLAGPGSVQDELAQRGYTITRVQ